MLVELAIRDFAIIEDTRIPFEAGLNALTGETGAGKSILIDALGAVLGERVSSDMVRTGAKAARIEATFDVAAIQDRADVAAAFEEYGVEPEDVVSEVRDYRDVVEADPARLAEVEERLDAIKALKRKYGSTIEDVLRFGEEASRELRDLVGDESDVDALRARERTLAAAVGRLAADLSARRAEAGERLSAAVERAISELAMGRSSFAVRVGQADDADGVPFAHGGMERAVAIDVTGADRVEFLLAPNAGEALKPLGRVASGGETARLMLALKSILSDADETPTLVFDEVDVGVGGRSAQVVGEKLWALSRDHQVLVITHHTQIAAFAETHFRIEKGESGGRIVSEVARIDGAVRLDELAAMIDGNPPTPESRANARAMLDRVERWKAEHASAEPVSR